MDGARPKFDLEDRTFDFAKRVREYVQKFKANGLVSSDVDQVVRSSGSVGANYIEANESLGNKDFAMRIKICRKEAKETIYWLRLLGDGEDAEGESLINEARELMNIFAAIYRKIQ